MNNPAEKATSGFTLSVQLSKQVKQLCPASCPCSCHPRREIRSPESLARIFGRVYLRYCRIPRSRGRCTESMCQARQRSYAWLTYVFPPWLCSYIFSVTFMGDPLSAVRGPRLVPTHSDVLRLSSLNEVERLRSLFEKGTASPFDASAHDGRTVLHVSSPLPTLILSRDTLYYLLNILS